MGFEIPSLSALRRRVLQDLAPGIAAATVLQRVERRLGNAVAAVSFSQYEWMRRLWVQFWPDTATGFYLDRWAVIYQVPRKGAGTGSGTARITGTPGALIPNNAIIARKGDGNQARVVGAQVIPGGGTLDVVVTTVDSGSAGNSEPGTEYSFVSTPAQVDPVVTIVSSTDYINGIADAVDEEGDEPLRARLLLRIGNPPQGGATWDYEGWALQVPGITRAWATAKWNGEGSMRVVVVSDESNPITPPPSKLQEVLDYMQNDEDGPAPGTDIITVLAPTLLLVDIDMILSPNTPDVQEEVTNQLEAYFALREIGDAEPFLYPSNISEAISSSPSEDWHQLIAPDPNTPIPVGATELPVLGTINYQDP